MNRGTRRLKRAHRATRTETEKKERIDANGESYTTYVHKYVAGHGPGLKDFSRNQTTLHGRLAEAAAAWIRNKKRS